ncbi:hypothetical protein [Prochlorothrix hollandica]|uniref:hypothetical protein n=1 Tax=Prochlorothrix hollandica TaxID=1223 RepID=UPI00333FB6D0
MTHPLNPSVLQYHINKDSCRGYLLTLGEYLLQRPDHYLYQLNYRVASEDAAWYLLNRHLEVLGCGQVSRFTLDPHDGHITLQF